MSTGLYNVFVSLNDEVCKLIIGVCVSDVGKFELFIEAFNLFCENMTLWFVVVGISLVWKKKCVVGGKCVLKAEVEGLKGWRLVCSSNLPWFFQWRQEIDEGKRAM